MLISKKRMISFMLALFVILALSVSALATEALEAEVSEEEASAAAYYTYYGSIKGATIDVPAILYTTPVASSQYAFRQLANGNQWVSYTDPFEYPYYLNGQAAGFRHIEMTSGASATIGAVGYVLLKFLTVNTIV